MICPATHLAVGLPMWVSRSGDGIWQPPIKKTAQNDDRPAWQVAASTASSAANHSLSLSYFILCVCVLLLLLLLHHLTNANRVSGGQKKGKASQAGRNQGRPRYFSVRNGAAASHSIPRWMSFLPGLFIFLYWSWRRFFFLFASRCRVSRSHFSNLWRLFVHRLHLLNVMAWIKTGLFVECDAYR